MNDPSRPGMRRSYWLREALAVEGNPVPLPAHRGDTEADVLIVGGGYTGLWTALFLTEYEPGLSITLLEQDVCGGGASGRNGGFATGWWDELPRLVDLFGDASAVELCRAVGESIRGIGAWCDDHEVDAWFTPGGFMAVAASEAQEGGLDATMAEATRLRVTEEFVPLSAVETQERCSSPLFRTGAFMRDGATVQPARLARGLRSVLLERGVQIFERSPVRAFSFGDPCAARTEEGTVRAGVGVIAVNAWGVGWPELRRLTVARGSYIVLTEPIPDHLEALGWTGGECITDLRTSTHYFRTTPDGRIAFGGGGASTGVGNKLGKTFTHDWRAAARTAEGFRRIFPDLADVQIVESWGGAVDVSPMHLPVFGRLGPNRCFFGLGYTGNGVGPSYLGGRILAGMSIGREDHWTSLPLVDYVPIRYPLEPIRSLGARFVNRAVVEKDRQEERKSASSRMVNAVARLPSRLGYRLPPE